MNRTIPVLIDQRLSKLPQRKVFQCHIDAVLFGSHSFHVNATGYTGPRTVIADESINFGTVQFPNVSRGNDCRVEKDDRTGAWHATEYISTNTCIPTTNSNVPNIPLPAYRPPLIITPPPVISVPPVIRFPPITSLPPFTPPSFNPPVSASKSFNLAYRGKAKVGTGNPECFPSIKVSGQYMFTGGADLIGGLNYPNIGVTDVQSNVNSPVNLVTSYFGNPGEISRDLIVLGNYVYAAASILSGSGSLYIYQFDPMALTLTSVATYAPSGGDLNVDQFAAYSAAVGGVIKPFLVITDTGGFLRTVDVSNPTSPTETGSITYAGGSVHTAIWVITRLDGSVVAVLSDGFNLYTFDITDPSSITALGSASFPNYIGTDIGSTFAGLGNSIYCADIGIGGSPGIVTWDISNPAHPTKTNTIPYVYPAILPSAFCVEGTTLFCFSDTTPDSVYLYDISKKPTLMNKFTVPNGSPYIHINAGRFYVGVQSSPNPSVEIYELF